jgi:hypothetical protein
MSHIYCTTYYLIPCINQGDISSFVEQRSEVFFYDISTYHLSVLEFHSLAGDYAYLLFVGCDDEEESVVETPLSYTVLVKNLESNIYEFVSLSVRYEYREDLLGGRIFMLCELGGEEFSLLITEYA